LTRSWTAPVKDERQKVSSGTGYNAEATIIRIAYKRITYLQLLQYSFRQKHLVAELMKRFLWTEWLNTPTHPIDSSTLKSCSTANYEKCYADNAAPSNYGSKSV
jgi:hypothetical protein